MAGSEYGLKILVDTNILIDFLDRSTEEMARIFEEEDIIVCGAVRAELLRGAVSERNFETMKRALEEFKSIDPGPEDWDLLCWNLYLLRRRGVNVPFVDVLISTIAINHDLTVWTNDKHFRLIQSVLHGLKLLQVSEEP